MHPFVRNYPLARLMSSAPTGQGAWGSGGGQGTVWAVIAAAISATTVNGTAKSSAAVGAQERAAGDRAGGVVARTGHTVTQPHRHPRVYPPAGAHPASARSRYVLFSFRVIE
ncbi:hypothetical protein Psi01_49020 [Planobispora siamensis]|uniref:Uncharacterized protein n=1 Tax=Planobispora siamensis TaxID=936338 RepID=A0A8J3SJW5_9ACTN|nr:hypothetical protein Psi01_49020 [Planobispora siamensis]